MQTTISNLFVTCSVALLLLSCDAKKSERLQAENDSLRNELEKRYSVMVMMKDITVLLDSIDESRNALHINLREGTTYEEVTDRLTDINKYVKRTSDKIMSMEQDLRSAKGESDAYLMMVVALKDELSMRAAEVAQLEKQVVDYQQENKGLVKTVKLQEHELANMHVLISTKKQELNLLEAKVEEMVDNFKVSEAEAYFARGQAIEEAAKRTKLAPGKKKETYKEALALYKKAFELGKQDAQAKVTELEKKVR